MESMARCRCACESLEAEGANTTITTSGLPETTPATVCFQDGGPVSGIIYIYTHVYIDIIYIYISLSLSLSTSMPTSLCLVFV